VQNKLYDPALSESAEPGPSVSRGAGDRSPVPLMTARSRAVAWRLALTVWLVYVLHFSSNVVRETYLAVTLAERFSIRVDEYLGLHPDLFQIEGRGSFINNNPGASLLGALPYAAGRPFVSLLFSVRPELAQPKPPAQYNDPRPNRTRFMNEARARGVDVKLVLAAAITHAGLMAPLAALAAVVMFFFLHARLRNESRAMWLALLYAFGTPVFFRSAFLNQNVLLTHCVLFAYVIVAGFSARTDREPIAPVRAALAGLFLGLGVLCDYSAAPLFLVFGIWVMSEGFRGPTRGRSGWQAGAAYALGALGPGLILLLYQWRAFGNPLLPAQAYMPATEYSVKGWNGFVWPTITLLKDNLISLQYGLLVFCPMLIAALLAPWMKRAAGSPNARELRFIFAATLATYLFNSSIQFAHLQFNTGVRYMVPVVPLLFMALVPVLLAAPRWLTWLLVVPTMVISWSVSMAREDVPTSLMRVFLRGFELPWLTVLEKTASGYAPFLANGVSAIPIFCLTAVVLWLLWRGLNSHDSAGRQA